MFELVSARCPACGATLKVDSRQPIAQCEYCGQRSMLRQRGAPARPPPPAPGAAAGTPPMTVIELPDMRRRVGLILLLTLLPLILVSVLVFVIISEVRDRIDQATGSVSVHVPGPGSSAFGPTADDDDDDDDNDVPLPTISDYLANPHDITERVRRGVVDPPVVRSLSVERSSVEVYPADGQRYSITFKGQALRRGGARPVPEPTFDLNLIDLSVLPGILDAVKQTHGASPSKALLEAEGGTPQWKIHTRKDGKALTLRFEIDGTPVED